MTQNNLIHVIIGPTASGKSAYALDLAQEQNGVVINCDAMQSYDALHILTAQPDAEEQAQAPHRLYGHLHPSRHYSAADWRADAIHEIEQCFANGQTPIICGGTGFYLKALMEGFSPVPEIPNDVRDKGIALQAELGNPAFHEQLKSDDPMVDGKIDPMNTQRNIRAWEVFHHTGRSIVDWQNEPLTGAPDGYEFNVTALFPNREKLIEKINARLDIMMDLGILDEVWALDDLIQSGEVEDDALVVKAHGFRPFRHYLKEAWTLNQAIEQTQTETRQYAKRQMTWLRNQLTIDKIIETP
jgi:tRNA dimethylallyltransferase